jgi:competence protein ComEA
MRARVVGSQARRARSEPQASGVGAAAPRAWAGWLLASALVVLASAPAPRAPAACEQPREAEARAGHSVAVRCGAPAAGRPLRGPARRLFSLPIDPNLADAPTLETLPGIGPARAAAILRERERAPFASAQELARVRGIGPRTLERLAGLVDVGGAE